MVVLIGVIMALGALYWWLRGHWFARVIMLLPLAVGLGLLGVVAAHSQELWFIGGVIGVAAAWFVSGLPIYYHRYQARASPAPGALQQAGPPAYFTGSSPPK